MTYKLGSQIDIGEMIFIGIEGRTGRISKFLDHPQFSERNPGFTARVAVTDRGSITIIDQLQIQIPD